MRRIVSSGEYSGSLSSSASAAHCWASTARMTSMRSPSREPKWRVPRDARRPARGGARDRAVVAVGSPVTALADAGLYLRGAETLLASWEAYAPGSHGAGVIRSSGVAAAVFPTEPERGVYNNALLEGDLGSSDRADALDA